MTQHIPHPDDATLLLFAYGEAGEGGADPTAHLGDCAACRARLAAIERSRVAADWVLASATVARRTRRWAVVGALAAAAAVALVLLRPHPPTTALSLTVPRYVAPELAPLDSMLTRLEQEKLYAIP